MQVKINKEDLRAESRVANAAPRAQGGCGGRLEAASHGSQLNKFLLVMTSTITMATVTEEAGYVVESVERPNQNCKDNTAIAGVSQRRT